MQIRMIGMCTYRRFLWAYRTNCKKLTGETPFQLVYGQEEVMSIEYIVTNLRIIVVTEMTDRDVMEERLTHLLVLEEDRFFPGFHQ